MSWIALRQLTSKQVMPDLSTIFTFMRHFCHDLANNSITRGNYMQACMWAGVLLPHAAALVHKGNILSKRDNLLLFALGTLLGASILPCMVGTGFSKQKRTHR